MLSFAHFRRSFVAIVLATVFVLFSSFAACAVAGEDEPHAHPAVKDGGAKHGDHDVHKQPTALEHVMDDHKFHFFSSQSLKHLHLPNVFGFQITKFMVLEVVAALLVIAIYVPLARRLRTGEPARGAFANSFEVLLTFVRDQIARPSLGEDKADRYMPFLWTLFLFILFNNLLGLLPFLGSATASIYVTGALALIVFFAIHGSAILAMGSASSHGHGHGDHGHGHGDHSHGDHGHGDHGHGHGDHYRPVSDRMHHVVGRGSARYAQSLWPQIDVPIPVLGFLIKLLVFLIEIVGIIVRNAVLAVRLFANMFAGHVVLATILLFITMAANAHPLLWGTITFSSVFGILALSLLELFVACLQAYLFTFLTALFMGMAISPQH
jgi:F-type H+-transporting ATPase subunit a